MKLTISWINFYTDLLLTAVLYVYVKLFKYFSRFITLKQFSLKITVIKAIKDNLNIGSFPIYFAFK